MSQFKVVVAEGKKPVIVVFCLGRSFLRHVPFGGRNGILQAYGKFSLCFRLQAIGICHNKGNVRTKRHPFLVSQILLAQFDRFLPVLDRICGGKGGVDKVLNLLMLREILVQPIEGPKRLPVSLGVLEVVSLLPSEGSGEGRSFFGHAQLAFGVGQFHGQVIRLVLEDG